jgi:hypothetical protein
VEIFACGHFLGKSRGAWQPVTIPKSSTTHSCFDSGIIKLGGQN